VTETRRAIARIVESHLDEILDRVMAAYEVEVPSVAASTDATKRRVRESTRRASLAFLALFADPETPARQVLNEARNATVDRAGEMFERDDIIAMIRVGRQVVYQSARTYVRDHVTVDPAHEDEMSVALEAFMRELERTEELLPQADDALQHLLASAETEGPDLG